MLRSLLKLYCLVDLAIFLAYLKISYDTINIIYTLWTQHHTWGNKYMQLYSFDGPNSELAQMVEFIDQILYDFVQSAIEAEETSCRA